MPEKRVLTTQEVEAHYGIPAATLANWRWRKIGPKYSKPGKRILYRIADLEEYLQQTQVKTNGYRS